VTTITRREQMMRSQREYYI